MNIYTRKVFKIKVPVSGLNEEKVAQFKAKVQSYNWNVYVENNRVLVIDNIVGFDHADQAGVLVKTILAAVDIKDDDNPYMSKFTDFQQEATQIEPETAASLTQELEQQAVVIESPVWQKIYHKWVKLNQEYPDDSTLAKIATALLTSAKTQNLEALKAYNSSMLDIVLPRWLKLKYRIIKQDNKDLPPPFLTSQFP